MLIGVLSKVSSLKKLKAIFKKWSLALFLKTSMEPKTFICMWKSDWELNCQLAYYQVKWSEEFKPDYCPYELVYSYKPSCFSLRNSESWWMLYIFPCVPKMFPVFLRINCFHWVTNGTGSLRVNKKLKPECRVLHCKLFAQWLPGDWWLWGRLRTRTLFLLNTLIVDQLSNTINTLLLRIIAFTHWK